MCTARRPARAVVPPVRTSAVGCRSRAAWRSPAEGLDWQEYAFQRVTQANPFPSQMGRVCPAPCQDGCNRNEVEDYVGINAVEQYIGDYAKEKGFAFDRSPKRKAANGLPSSAAARRV